MSAMATLRHQQTQQRVELTDPTLVGRSRTCHLRLTDSHVSGTHATLSWSGQQWEVRDLGSRNGTFLDGHRLPSGQRGALSASGTVAFGDVGDSWEIVDTAPPAASAASGEEQRRATDGLLALPSEAAPEVCVYRSRAGWRADAGTRSWLVSGGDTVEAGGRTWTLGLPEDLRPTQELASGALSLEFAVSRDEEHIELTAHVGGKAIPLGHRAHSYLLLTLARARHDDAGLPEAEQGWVYHDELSQRMNLSEGHFNMLIFRARQQLAQAGPAEGTELIERRRGSRQIRLGVPDLRIRSL